MKCKGEISVGSVLKLCVCVCVVFLYLHVYNLIIAKNIHLFVFNHSF